MKNYYLLITENAESEYKNAFRYYEEKQTGLGVRFERELDVLLNLLTKNPLLFQRKYKRYREALVRNLPYFIVFEIIEDAIVVHSVFHTSRDPMKKFRK